MHKGSFTLEAWQSQDPTQSVSHLKQLLNQVKPSSRKPSPGYKKRPKIKLPSHKAPKETTVEEHSLNSYRKQQKMYTEQVDYKQALDVSKVTQLRKETQDHQIFMAKKNINKPVHASIVTLIQHKKKAQSRPKFVFKSQANSRASKNKTSTHCSTDSLPKAFNLPRSDKLMPAKGSRFNQSMELESKKFKLYGPGKDTKRIREFYNQTFHNSQRFELSQSQSEKRWKNMLLNAKKKKKELQDLFKTRAMFGPSRIDKKVQKQHISKMLIEDSTESEENYKRMMQTQRQFNDSMLYSPTVDNPGRETEHLRSKNVS